MHKHIRVGRRSLEISSARRSWNDARLFRSWNKRHFVWWKLSIIYQWDWDCDVCTDTTYDGHGDSCQSCCPHSEYDHGICYDCGKDCTDDLVSAAEYAFEGDR